MNEENEGGEKELEETQDDSAETAEETTTEELTGEGEEEISEDEIVEAEEDLSTVMEEEVKPPTREEAIEEEIVEERIYTIPLRKAWIAPRNKRAPKAIRIIKAFVTKHMKLETRIEEEMGEEEPKKLIIRNEVNEKVWRRGIEKPPRKIRVRAAKDKNGNITLYLAEGD